MPFDERYGAAKKCAFLRRIIADAHREIATELSRRAAGAGYGERNNRGRVLPSPDRGRE